MMISLFVDKYMSICRGFPSECSIFEFQEFQSDSLGKSCLSYTPCAHLTCSIELGLEAPWTMLSRIGLVPRVIREGLALKAAISCHLGELGAPFVPSYHEIIIGEFLSWIHG